ncbi:MAG: HEAT repeat domain-containing protein [Euryarchaeota archaeon]|nr:HEAT repeat domain-containing protein [Euryarchaeota archaeon]
MQEVINKDLLSKDRKKTIQTLSSLENMLRAKEANASSIPPLTLLLIDVDIGIRRQAIWSIGKLAQNKVTGDYPVDDLINLLADEDSEVRENAAWALGELAGIGVGKEEAICVLNVLIQDHDPNVRSMAIWTLGRMAERMHLSQSSSVLMLKESLMDDRLLIRKGAEWALERMRSSRL